jgi:U3 small nucleolar RNA-associated protein 7
VCFLHNELFFAAAQRKYVYIYDKRGLEVHCLREHTAPTALQFLPHHFLLASIGESGEPLGCRSECVTAAGSCS